MFVRSIEETAFTSKVADELFADRGLEVGAFRGDLSLRATLRALLLHRPTGKVIADVIDPMVKQSEIKTDEDIQKNIWMILPERKILEDDNYESILSIISLNNFTNAQAIMDFVTGKLGELLPGFREMKDLRKFVENYNVNARFLINEEKKRTLIFVEHMTNRTFHFLQAFTSRYLLWYFEGNQPQGQERALIEGLTKRNPDSYIKALNEIAKDEDFRIATLKSMLNGFESRMHQKKLEAVRDEIGDCRAALERIEESFQAQYKRMEQLTTEEFGLREKIRFGGEGHEVLDYFLSSKVVHLVSTERAKIEFVVTTTIGNYDPEAFLSAVNNDHSWVYNNWEDDDGDVEYPWNKENIEMLMRAIFEEEVVRLRVCAAFKLNFENGSYTGVQGYNFGLDYADYTPNQHIQHYGCLGNNASLICEAMNARDYIGAIDACVASTGNMNMNEPTTMSYFLQDILKENAGKFIEMPDGTNVTPKEALVWLKKRAEGQEEQK